MRIVALALALLLTRVAVAQTAFVLTPTVCDNQSNAFVYKWASQKNQNLRLFFMGANGDVNSIGHGEEFNKYPEVMIAAHGEAGEIGDMLGADFAEYFKAAHPETPKSVEFYACGAADTTNGSIVSVQQDLSRQYPLNAQGPENRTAIGTLRAGSRNCSLRGPIQENGQKITAIQHAVYLQAAGKGVEFQTLGDRLKGSWEKALYDDNDPNRPTFETYCSVDVLGNPSALLADFLDKVYAQYHMDYLALINQRFGGDPLYTCGNRTSYNPC